MQETMRTDTFNDFRYYNWRLINDVDDNNFEPLVNKVMDSKQSWFITGPGGSGKTSLIKDLQQKMDEQDLKYISLQRLTFKVFAIYSFRCYFCKLFASKYVK